MKQQRRELPIEWPGEKSRRLSAWICLLSMLVQGVSGAAYAAPTLFAVKGAGASREPLSALAFNVPGFGDLEQATNLANGNLLVSVDGLSHNNLFSDDAKDSKTKMSSMGWSIADRLQLDEFDPTVAPASYPATLSLLSGDGSRNLFDQVTPDSATAPTWITRYSGANSAVRTYRLRQEAGKSFKEVWIVVVAAPSQTVAHYYAPDGTRTTFARDGKYADYSQDLYQQQRGATAGSSDTEGLASTTPKTEYTYLAGNEGFISKVKDEWGRTTMYDWDTTNKVVINIYSALTLTDDPNSALRKIAIHYSSADQAIDQVTVSARQSPDMPMVDRVMKFGYKWQNVNGYNHLLMTSMSKPVAGSNVQAYTYTYDNQGRVTNVHADNNAEPDVIYGYNGSQVTVTQGIKRQVFTFDSLGELVRSDQDDINPNDGSKRILYTKYAYYNDGNVGLITQGSQTGGVDKDGKTVQLAYDQRGNLIRQSTYGKGIVPGTTTNSNPGGATDPITVQVGGFSSPNTKPSTSTAKYDGWVSMGSTFQLTATVSADQAAQGVSWWNNGVQLTTGVPSNTTPVVLSGSPIKASLANGQYSVTQTFQVLSTLPQNSSTPASGLPVTLTAKSLKDPTASQPYSITIASPMSQLGLQVEDMPLNTQVTSQSVSSKVQKIIVAPGEGATDPSKVPSCLKREEIDTIAQTASLLSLNCKPSLLVKVTATTQPWYNGDSTAFISKGSLTIGNSDGNSRIAIKPIGSTTGNYELTIPWDKSLATYDSNSNNPNRYLTLSYIAADGTKLNDVALLLGYFGFQKATAPKGQWDSTVYERSTYQYAVGVINSPDGNQKLVWNNLSNFQVNHPNTPDDGCLYAISGFTDLFNYTKPGTVHVESSTFPAVSLSMPATVKWRWLWSDWGEGCDTATYKNGLVPGQTFAIATTAKLSALGLPDSTPIGAVSLNYPTSLTPGLSGQATTGTTQTGSGTPITDLSNTLVPGSLHHEEFSYDTTNRQTQSIQYGASGQGYSYQDVTDATTYQEPSITINGQTFLSTQGKTTTHSVGGVLKSTRTEVISPVGLQTQNTLSWNGKSRTTSTQYWKDQSSQSATYQKLNLAATFGKKVATIDVTNFQYGDLPYSEAVTTSATDKAVTPDSKIFYKYDLMSRVVENSQGNVIKSVIFQPVILPTSLPGKISAQAKPNPKMLMAQTVTSDQVATPVYGNVIRHYSFDGFDNKIWERTNFDDAVTSEKGWSYDAAGGLATEWLGTPLQLTAHTYTSAGFLESTIRGIGSGTADNLAKVNTIRSSTKYSYDLFGRVSSQSVQRPGQSNTFDQTLFTYDTLDRQVTKTLPDSTVISTWYDETGAVSKETQPYQTQTTTHDSLGYTTSETVMDLTSTPSRSNTITYQNDAYGRMVTATSSDTSIDGSDADRTTTNQYDSEGHLLVTVGPRMRTVADSGSNVRWLTDNRRPITQMTYDELGNKVTESKGLYGQVMGGQGTITYSDKNSAVTTYTNDELGHVVSVLDPDNYISTMAYDSLGHTYRTSRQFYNGQEMIDNQPVGFKDDVEAYTFVTPEGFPTSTIGSAVHPQEKTYDSAGNLLTESQNNQNGAKIVRKAYTYTPDGLLLSTYEPLGDADAATISTFNPDQISGFEATSTNTYTNSLLPSSTMTTVNDSEQAVTKYEYNWLGKTVKTTLPDATVITQEYDYLGNQTRLTNSEGTTTNKYSASSHIIDSEQTSVGAPNTINNQPISIRSAYLYDAYDNLIRKTENGYTTDYIYNMLGKVIAESRARGTVEAYPSTGLFKKTAYRLDGAVMAQTSYTYADSGQLQDRQQADGGLKAEDISAAAQTAGNLQILELSPGGLAQKVSSYGYMVDANGITGNRVNEYTKTMVYNGLGLRIFRYFTGDPRIAVQQRDPATGAFKTDANGAQYTDYKTFSYYSSTGELLTQYNTLGDDAEHYTFDTYRFGYNNYSKPVYALRWLSRQITPFTPNSGLGNSVIIAASSGMSNNIYDNRDRLIETDINDKSPAGTSSLETSDKIIKTKYSYYPNGAKKTEEVLNNSVSSGMKTTTYDMLGRVKHVSDSNGTSIPLLKGVSDGQGGTRSSRTVGTGVADINYEYGVNKTTITTSWDGSVPKDGSTGRACVIAQTTETTIGGLITGTTESDTCDTMNLVTKTTTTYSDYALPAHQHLEARPANATAGSTSDFSQTSDTFFNYDNFGNQTRQTTNTTSTYNSETNTTNKAKSRVYSDDGYLVLEDTSPCQYVVDNSGNCLLPASKINNSTVTIVRPSELVKPLVAPYDPNVELKYKFNQFTAIYTVDSQGDRISVSGGPFDGYIKRYDADGKTAMFFKQKDNLASYSDFVYDPEGQEVLSSTAAFSNDTATYSLYRSQSSNYVVDGQVQVIRKREGTISNSPQQYFLIIPIGGGYYNSYDTNDVIRDATYSMADGLADVIDWNAVVLFDTKAAGNVTVFEAPKKTVSATTTLDPTIIKAPNQARPPVITTPSQAPKAPKTPPVVVPQTQTQPTQGTVGQNQQVGTITTLGTVGSTKPVVSKTEQKVTPSNASSNTSAVASSVNFGVPQSVLSPSAQAVSPAQVNAPNANRTTPIPPTTSSANQPITAPNQAKIPAIIANPQDGTNAIQPPNSVKSPNIPAIGTGVNKPIGTGTADTKVKTNAILVIPVDQYIAQQQKGIDTVDDQLRNLKNAQDSTLGDALKTEKYEFKQKLALMEYTNENYHDQVYSMEKVLIGIEAIDEPNIRIEMRRQIMEDIGGNGNPVPNVREYISGLADTADKAISMRESGGRLAYSMIATMNTLDQLRNRDFANFTNPGRYLAFKSALSRSAAETLLPWLTNGYRALTGKQFGVNQPIALWERGLSAVAVVGAVFGVKGYFAKGALVDEEVTEASMLSNCFNSFVAQTPVLTVNGLIPIAALAIGDKVLAYNEQKSQNDYYPITAVHKNLDTQITYLTLAANNKIKSSEIVTTTPEHPFYLQEQADLIKRPKPVGHEDLNNHWVGAGHLLVGDKIKKADGTFGIVTNVTTIQQTEEMFNLTVDQAHTFYVGNGGWLVHNGSFNGTCWTANVLKYTEKERQELARLMGKWDKGTFDSVEDSIMYHATKHGDSDSLLRYLRQADAFTTKGARKKVIELANGGTGYRWEKNGQYLITDTAGKKLSFGTLNPPRK